MRPGDVVLATLSGAVEAKLRPSVVIASRTYLTERPDVIVGILTSRLPQFPASTDYALADWQRASLHVPSYFRAYLLTIRQSNATVIGHLSDRDWVEVRTRVRLSLAE